MTEEVLRHVKLIYIIACTAVRIAVVLFDDVTYRRKRLTQIWILAKHQNTVVVEDG